MRILVVVALFAKINCENSPREGVIGGMKLFGVVVFTHMT